MPGYRIPEPCLCGDPECPRCFPCFGDYGPEDLHDDDEEYKAERREWYEEKWKERKE